MENTIKTPVKTRQELNNRQLKRLRGAKNERAKLEVKLMAQLSILNGQRGIVKDMERLYEEIQKDLTEADEYIKEVYNTYNVE